MEPGPEPKPEPEQAACGAEPWPGLVPCDDDDELDLRAQVTRLTQENTLLWLAVNEMRTEMGLHRVRPSARRERSLSAVVDEGTPPPSSASRASTPNSTRPTRAASSGVRTKIERMGERINELGEPGAHLLCPGRLFLCRAGCLTGGALICRVPVRRRSGAYV